MAAIWWSVFIRFEQIIDSGARRAIISYTTSFKVSEFVSGSGFIVTY